MNDKSPSSRRDRLILGFIFVGMVTFFVFALVYLLGIAASS